MALFYTFKRTAKFNTAETIKLRYWLLCFWFVSEEVRVLLSRLAD